MTRADAVGMERGSELPVALLALFGDDTDDEAPRKADTFRRLFYAVAWVHVWALGLGFDGPWLQTLVMWTIALGAPLGCLRPRSRIFPVLLFGAASLRIWWAWPAAYNHMLIEVLVAAALASFRPGDPLEERSLLQCLRWLAVSVMFWSGVQKVLHGLYFRGEFLAAMVAQDGRFRFAYGLLFPDETARIMAIGKTRLGAGPYRFESGLAIALSNAVWIGEIVSALLTFDARTRRAGAALACGLLIGIELVARELVFGGMFAALWLLFFPPHIQRRGTLVVAAVLLATVPIRMLWPEWVWN